MGGLVNLPADFPDHFKPDIDLGNDHWLQFMGHGGEGVTNTATGEPVPYTEKYGASVLHRCAKTESGWDEGFVTFDTPAAADNASPKWTVDSWDPLTLSPSLLQGGCGDHGFIRQGKWVKA